MQDDQDERGFFGEAPVRLPPRGKAAGPALEERPHYLGHRERLRERFQQAGLGALSDYEILELLLFRSIPRADTKERAKALIKRFGSLAEVLGAPEQRLKEIDGIGASAALDLKIIAAAAQRMARSEIKGRELLESWDKVLAYCHAAMAFEPKEHFRILFLDKKNLLIADEVQQTGTIDHTPVYPREVAKRALEHSASAIVLVHNHPSGDPTPSRADIDMTKQIIAVCKPLGVSVHDHLIIGRSGFASMKGLLLI